MAKINPNIKRKLKNPTPDAINLLEKIISGDRYALSQAITLIESNATEDQRIAETLISELIRMPGHAGRIAISGSPGAGKSTLIEALGFHTISLGFRPAVLAVDPSSQTTGGSILGDKVRMEKLSQSKEAFIRPSPAGDFVGGTNRKTRESILLLEKAGYNPIFIETVGVGQTETIVHSMTDLFVLVVAPGSGDDIQGIKRGIVEMADILVINKMDGELAGQALISMQHYAAALQIMHNQGAGAMPEIIGVSSVIPSGIDQLWETIRSRLDELAGSGAYLLTRQEQEILWYESEVYHGIFRFLLSDPVIAQSFAEGKERVRSGKISAIQAAHVFFEKLGKKIRNEE